MRCNYFKCEPKSHAICCLDSMLSLTGREIKEHKVVLNKNGILLGTYLGLFSTKEVQRYKELIGKVDRGVNLYYSLRELGLDLDFEIAIDLIYYTYALLEKEETLKFCKKNNLLAFAKCPYYDENKAKCSVYEDRFYQCKLFPHFRREKGLKGKNPTIELCLKCNPESCSPVPRKGYTRKSKIIKREIFLRNKMLKEFEEFRKIHSEVLTKYFALLGKVIYVLFQSNKQEEVVNLIKSFIELPTVHLTVDLSQVVWGGSPLVLLPYSSIYIALLYFHFDWNLEESIKALENYLEYTEKHRLIPQAEETKKMLELYRNALIFQGSFSNLEDRNLIETGLKITEQTLKTFLSEENK